MKNDKLILLKDILNEIERRNIAALYGYNTGRLVHQKQLEFHKSQKRNRWVFGGNRTGKTECGAVETVWLALGIHPYRPNRSEIECWVVSLSTRVQTEVAQAKILKYLPAKSIVNIVMVEGKKGAPQTGVIKCILVRNSFGKISKIWFKSCEEGREKFQGASLDFVWFDEEPPEEVYRECQMRVLDKSGEIFGTMTPLKGFTFVYDEIYLNKRGDNEVFCVFMSWLDNPHLNKNEIERLKQNLSEDEIESRMNGKFVSRDVGLVYSEFDANVNIIEPFEIDPQWQDTLSIDPGLSNPLSCHWYARDFDGNVYVVAEHFEANQTIEHHAAKIKEISKRLGWKKAPNGMIEALIDSAANQRTLSGTKSVTELFYDNGVLVNPNVNKNLLAGISKVKSYIKNSNGETRLFIFSSCTNLIREIKSYKWSGGDAPIKFDDHALDEMRYYIMNISSPKTPTAIKSDIQKNKERLIRMLKRR